MRAMPRPKIGKTVAAAFDKREKAMTAAIETRHKTKDNPDGLTYAEMAALCGVSPQTFQAWKNTGFRNITRMQYGLLARKLHITSEENDAITGIGSEY